MGLGKDFPKGTYLNDATFSAHVRFNSLHKGEDGKAQPLNLMTIKEAHSSNVFENFGKQDKSYQCINCQWQKHAFSINLVKEGDNIHIIYTNRGQRMSGPEHRGDKAVMVYTVKNDEQGAAFLKKMGTALASEKQDTISTFFSRPDVVSKKNSELTRALAKSEQKMGNCGLANSNIAWHIALAQEYRGKPLR